MTDGWQTYTNAKAGYAIDYPASWTVQEDQFADGSLSTGLEPPGGGRGIEVVVQPGTQVIGVSDMGNVRCHEVQVAALKGMQCVDTIARSMETALTARGKTYTVSTSLKGEGNTIYAHVLSSFRIVS